MDERPPHHLWAMVATGRLSPADVGERALDALDAAPDPTREAAIRALVTAHTSDGGAAGPSSSDAACASDPAVDIADTVDTVVSSLCPGRTLTPGELAALSELATQRPRAFGPLVDTVGTALSRPDESELSPELAARFVGDIGAETPGVVKSALGPLLGLTADGLSETEMEAAWAVVRTATAEPATLRPTVAGRVWNLDSESHTTVVDAIETLGRVGWLLPERLAGVDELAARVDHPHSDVRAAAVRALGRLANGDTESDLHVPCPERVEPFLEQIAALLGDPVANVRQAAARALEQVAAADPTLVYRYVDQLRQATTDDAWEVRVAALDALRAVLTETPSDADHRSAGEDINSDCSAVDIDRLAADLDLLVSSVRRRLADGDRDVEAAAVTLFVALADELGAEHAATARSIVDALVWFEAVVGSSFAAPAVFETLDDLAADSEITLDAARHLPAAVSLCDAPDGMRRHVAVKLLGLVARQSPDCRLTALQHLQRLLADTEQSVRRQVLEECRELVDTDPRTATVVTPIVLSVFNYDPELRATAASVLVACDPPESVLADAVELQCEVVADALTADSDADDGGGLDDLLSESPVSPLETFVESVPHLVVEAAPPLIEHLDQSDDLSELLVRHLALAVAESDTVDTRLLDAAETFVQSDTSPTLLAWLSTCLVLGTDAGDVRDQAVDRLHSLTERREATAAAGCVDLLADHDPALAARLLVGRPPVSQLPRSEASSITGAVTSHPRLLLRCRGQTSPYADRRPLSTDVDDTDWLSELVRDSPQAVPAARWLRDGFWSDDGSLTAALLRSVGRPEALTGGRLSVPHDTSPDATAHDTPTDATTHDTPTDTTTHDTPTDATTHDTPTDATTHDTPTDSTVHRTPPDTLDSWTAHPHPEVRAAARTLADRPTGFETLTDEATSLDSDTRSTLSGVDPAAVTTETVDELATVLAAPSAQACRRASELLVSVAVASPDHRAYVRQHLLASAVTLDAVAAPESLLGALVILTPDSVGRQSALHTEAEGNADETTLRGVLVQYARVGSPPVRDVALCALGVAPRTLIDSVPVSLLTARLRDPDGVVRAQAARTVAECVGEKVDVSSELVTALCDALDGPRHVTIACCAALGRCGAVAPSVTDRVVSCLEPRLRSRSRGVRRAAASAVARIGRCDPTALTPVASQLVDRVVADRVVRPELFPAIAALPTAELTRVDRLTDVALSVLVTTTESAVSQAAGRTLHRLTTVAAGSIRTHLDTTAEQLEETYDDTLVSNLSSVELTPLSLYWLLRVVGGCSRGNRLVASEFDWLLSEAVDTLTDTPSWGQGTTGSLGGGGVTTRGLARVTARAAAFGGVDCYQTVLEAWPGDPAKPNPDADNIAQYLIVADSDQREQALTTIAGSERPPAPEPVLDRILDEDVSLNRYEQIVASLETLLPETRDKQLHRRGVEKLLAAASEHNWEIRRAAVETLGRLGATRVLPADEAVAHLFDTFDDGVRGEQPAAEAAGELVEHTHLGSETLFESAAAACARSEPSAKRRESALRLLAALARRDPSLRDRAVETLQRAADEGDYQIRQVATDGLRELGALLGDTPDSEA